VTDAAEGAERARAGETVEDRLRRETKFDRDLWLIESDDRQGRHFLDLAPQDEAP
jgi:hypothetical protein